MSAERHLAARGAVVTHSTLLLQRLTHLDCQGSCPLVYRFRQTSSPVPIGTTNASTRGSKRAASIMG